MRDAVEEVWPRLPAGIDGLSDADILLLTLLRRRGPMTRAALAAVSGLGRSTVVDRLNVLVHRRLIERVGNAASTGGRPADIFGLSHDGGVVVVADVSATLVRVAALDLSGRIVVDEQYPLAVPASSSADLSAVVSPMIAAIVDRMDAGGRSLYGVGLGIPGRLFWLGDSASRRAGYEEDATSAALGAWFSDRFGCAVVVDDRVNAMALGERFLAGEKGDLIFIDVDDVLGAGVISGGVVCRGASGGAGDVGHIYLAGHDDLPCTCGQFGCANAVASASAACAAFSRRLGVDVEIEDLLALASRADADAADVIRGAGRALGEIVAVLVRCFDPHSVVLGGRLSAAAAPLLAGVREAVYRRGPSRSSRDLHIDVSSDRVRVGLVGLAELTLDGTFHSMRASASGRRVSKSLIS